MTEKFDIKPVVGYEGLYMIDTLGNVLSLPKVQGRYFVNKYRVISHKINRMGYVEVTLCKGKSMRTRLLHRLLAEHFIPNPKALPCVNHRDGNKSNNDLSNLEWCTNSENTKHAYDNNLGGSRDRALANLAAINSETAYHSVRLVLDNVIKNFGSVAEAAEYLGTDRDNVTRAIRKHHRVKGWFAYGMKQDLANGETPQGQSRGKAGDGQSCIDYPREAE